MGGGKSRKQKVEQEVKLDPDIKKAAMEQLAAARYAASLPTVEQKAGTIAAFTPGQEAAMANLNKGLQAFGFDAPDNPLAGMPNATYTGGIKSYSIDPAYQDMKAGIPQEYLEGIQRIKDAYARSAKANAPGKGGDTSSGKGGSGNKDDKKKPPQNAMEGIFQRNPDMEGSSIQQYFQMSPEKRPPLGGK